MTYDSGNYEAATAKAKELFGYDELRAEQRRRRESNDPVQLGIGISTFTEMCGLAPSRILGALNYGAGGWESASIRMLATGKVEVITGVSPHGQGHETAWSQIVADRLGVPFEDVEVLHGDTQIASKGMDTYGSRSLVVGAEAVVRAADKVIEKAKPIAAHLLEASVDDIEFTAGRFGVKGTDKGVSMAEVALATWTGHNLPDGVEPTHRRRRDLRPGQLLLPARHPPVRDGGRHRDRGDDDAQVRLRRRHRHHHQPAHRRGPGARRPRPGHRPGALGGCGVRRPGHARDGLVRRLHPADVRRHDQLRHRPHDVAVDLRPPWAPRESARRAPSPRRRPSSTRSSTRCASFGVDDIVMPCTPERVWKAIQAGPAGLGRGRARRAAALRRGRAQPGPRRRSPSSTSEGSQP